MLRRYFCAFVSFSGRFLANGSHPAGCAPPTRSARNARARRRHVVAAARILQRCRRMASPRRIGRASAGFRRPFNWRDEESRIVDLNLADAVRRLAAARWTHSHISRSYCTPSLGHACAARREEPSHAAGGMALRCRPRMPPNPQLGAEAAPIQIIASDAMTECYFGRQSDRDGMWPMPTRANTPTNLKSRASARAGCRRGSLRGRGSGQARSGLLIFSLIAGPWGEGAGPGLGRHIETPSRMRRAEH